MPWIWSWLMPQTANLMEYFGLASASCPGSATSWTTWPPPKATSGRAANIPAELIVLRNERRLRPSFCICATPIYVDIVWGFLNGSLSFGRLNCAAGSIAEHIYSDAELYADFHHPQCSQWRRSLANPKTAYLLLEDSGADTVEMLYHTISSAMPSFSSVQVIDSLTTGEPTRVAIEGGPCLGRGALTERLACFRERYDVFRSGAVTWPRRSAVVVGADLLEPVAPLCDAGAASFN